MAVSSAARALFDTWQGTVQPRERASVCAARRSGGTLSLVERLGVRKASFGQRASSGFSLAETMVALIVVTMLTALVAANIPVAFRTFEAVQKRSNAQVALVSTTAALRGELSMATEIKNGGDSDAFVLSYVRADGDPAQLIQDEEHDGWFSVRNLATDRTTLLVPQKMTGGLGYELSGSIRYDQESKYFEISDFKVTAKEDGTPDSAPSLASISDDESETYSFRALRAQVAED